MVYSVNCSSSRLPWTKTKSVYFYPSVSAEKFNLHLQAASLFVITYFRVYIHLTIKRPNGDSHMYVSMYVLMY